MLFQRVYFAPRKFEIERFRNIAQHPVFSKTIKELVYDARLFREEYQETDAYIAMLSQQTRSFQNCVDIDLNDLERYSDCIEEQTYILDNKLDLHALLAGLSRMSIQRLTIQDIFHDHDQFPIHVSGHTWYDEMCQLRFPSFLPSSWIEFRLPNQWDDQAPDPFTWDCRGLAHLFHAFSEHCTSIHELHIGTQRSKAPMVLFQPSGGIIDIIDHIDRLAPQLTCLKLDCRPFRGDRSQDVDAAASRLAVLMSNAKALRALSLSGSERVIEQTSRGFLQGWQAWPRLSLLHLGHITTTQDILSAIIRAQKDTLSELTLRNILLQGPGSWERLGDEIGQLLRLQKVTVNMLSFKQSNMWVIPPTLHQQMRVVGLIMQWASPEMLETLYCSSEFLYSVVASLKSKGNTGLVDWSPWSFNEDFKMRD